MNTDFCGKGHGGAETEEDAERIERNIDDRDAELVDKGSREEVEQCEQPPGADEDGVIDDRGDTGIRACDVIAHKGGNKDGAEQLNGVSYAVRV